MRADHNRELYSRDGQSLLRFGIVALLICIFGLCVFVLVMEITRPRTHVFLESATPQSQFYSQDSSQSGAATIEIAYPSATDICMDGCRAHQNWIQFYLVSNSYNEDSFKLKTSLFLGQILTYGIGSGHCFFQDKVGYTCIQMELSHRLLGVLTGLYLTPLDQVRDTKNWWLEYTPNN